MRISGQIRRYAIMARNAGLTLLYLMLTCATFEAALADDDKARVTIVFDGGESFGASELRRAVADLEEVLELTLLAPGEDADGAPDEFPVAAQDIVLIDASVDGLTLQADDLERLRTQGAKVVLLRDDSMQSDASAQALARITRYWENRSLENDRGLILFLLSTVLDVPLAESPPEPIIYPDHGFYHPDADRLFDSSAAYEAWYTARDATPGQRPQSEARIGLIGHRVWVQKQETAALDALIREIESRGAMPLPMVMKGAVELDRYFMRDGAPIVDVVLYSGEMLDYKNPAAGRERLARLGVPVLLAVHHYRTDQAGYRGSPGGLAPALTPRVVFSERDGLLEPLVTSTRSPAADVKQESWPEQVAWRIDRAMSWAQLARKANDEKRVVVTYWSEAGGRADVGGDPDDFLDVPASAVALLSTLREQGYDTGNETLPAPQTLARRMAEEGSNVGSWAPGMLASRVEKDAVALIPEARYQRWFDDLPADLRNAIEDAWGPAPGRVMLHTNQSGERFLVVPRLAFGNVILTPHPMWGYYEDEQVLMSTGELPPHHQYLAFFLWLQEEWGADAWVSLFSNLVLQPGKSQGPLYDEAVGIMLGKTPHIHPERLGANGGLGAKRKTLAQTIGWYNIVVPTTQLKDLADLGGIVRRYRSQADPELRDQLGTGLREELASRGLMELLPLEADASDDAVAEALGDYLQELETENAPWGGRVLGSVPEDEALVAMLVGMLGEELKAPLAALDTDTPELRSSLVHAVVIRGLAPRTAILSELDTGSPDLLAALELAQQYATRLRAAPREIEGIVAALDGRWIEPGLAGEAYRNPDVLPPGRSVYGFDPAQMPTLEAERVGIKLAEELVATHRENHDGSYPQEMALVLWSGEIAKSQGVSEAQALHLLGTRPVRNLRGEVVDVELIPREELGRPRVDVLVTTSGTYRDQFQEKAELIARAAALAARSPEADNPVRVSTEESLAELESSGVAAERARRLSVARVFSPAPGAYSPSIQFLAKSGDQRGDDGKMAGLFTARMSHAYGNGLYGEPAEASFLRRLVRLDGAVMPRSSDVNGMLDHPMVAAFLGGLNLAARNETGRDIDLYVSNQREMGESQIESARGMLQRELRSRYFNPAWLRENQQHGYDGARNFMFMTDHLDLWDATAGEMVTSEDWQQVKEIFVDDRFSLDMDRFFDDNNPYAQQVLLTNLLGAAMRGDWEASAEDLAAVAERLIRSVADHGPACEANQCRNEAMTEFVGEALAGTPDAAPAAAAYAAAIEAATTAPSAATGAAPQAAPEVQGQQMETVYPSSESAPVVRSSLLLLVLAAVLLLVLGWYRSGLQWKPA